MISLGGSFAALPMMVRPVVAPSQPTMAPSSSGPPAAPVAPTNPVAPTFMPGVLVPRPVTTGTLAPEGSTPLCSQLCPNDKLHCQANGSCVCSSTMQPCYSSPPSTVTQPQTYTDPAGNQCPLTAVDASGYCPTLSSGTQQPYTDPNGVTCYPDQLDGYGYCPGSLTATGGGGSTQPGPSVPPPVMLPTPTYQPPMPDSGGGGGGDASQYASSQVPAPGMLVPVATGSPYSWSQLSTTAKIAVVLLGLGAVGGGYYWIKRRRRRAIAA